MPFLQTCKWSFVQSENYSVCILVKGNPEFGLLVNCNGYQGNVLTFFCCLSSYLIWDDVFRWGYLGIMSQAFSRNIYIFSGEKKLFERLWWHGYTIFFINRMVPYSCILTSKLEDQGAWLLGTWYNIYGKITYNI